MLQLHVNMKTLDFILNANTDLVKDIAAYSASEVAMSKIDQQFELFKTDVYAKYDTHK